MPSIDDFKKRESTSKKFKKVAYRPWTVISSDLDVVSEQHEQEINRKQTVNKLETNCIQSEDKLETNRIQSADKLETNCIQSGDKTGDKLHTKLDTNCIQLNQKPISFSRLIGAQKTLVFFIYLETKTAGSIITQPLTIDYIISCVNMSKSTVKTTLQRLEKKGCLLRSEYKNGRGGWSQYSLQEDIFREIMRNENCIQSGDTTGDKLHTKLETNCIQKLSTSSSSYSETTTTESESKKIFSEDGEELTQEDDEVKVSSLQHIGFSKAHIEQLKNAGLKNEMIQQSIDAFAFDLEHNGVREKIKTQPLNYFMGILRGGIPYAFPANYQDQKAVAMKAYLDGVLRVKEERQKLEEEIFESEFMEWKIQLTEDEVANIIPEKRYREYPIRDSFLKDHFKQKVWRLPKF